MTKIVQLHRLTSSQAATYVGPQGEIIGDLGANSLRFQDGATPGGFLLMQGSNDGSEFTNPAQVLTNIGAAALAGANFTGALEVEGDAVVTLIAQQTLSNKILVGSATNDSAAAGDVGEFIESLITTGAAINITSGVTFNLTSISLTPGDWDIVGQVQVDAGNNCTGIIAGPSQVSLTLPSAERYAIFPGTVNGNGTANFARQRISLAVTTVIFMVCQATFGGGGQAWGYINARRMR